MRNSTILAILCGTFCLLFLALTFTFNPPGFFNGVSALASAFFAFLTLQALENLERERMDNG